MHQEAITAILDRLADIQKHMDTLPVDATLSQMRGFVDERILQYRQAMEKASPTPASREDQARADILTTLKSRIAESKASSLSKKGLRDTVEALVSQQRAQASDTTTPLDFEIYRDVTHEMLFLRQTSEDKLCLPVSNLISQQLHVLHGERGRYLDHLPSNVVEAQVEALHAFLAHVDHALPSPLRKKDLSEVLQRWEHRARYGLPFVLS